MKGPSLAEGFFYVNKILLITLQAGFWTQISNFSDPNNINPNSCTYS